METLTADALLGGTPRYLGSMPAEAIVVTKAGAEWAARGTGLSAEFIGNTATRLIAEARGNSSSNPNNIPVARFGSSV